MSTVPTVLLVAFAAIVIVWMLFLSWYLGQTLGGLKVQVMWSRAHDADLKALVAYLATDAVARGERPSVPNTPEPLTDHQKAVDALLARYRQ